MTFAGGMIGMLVSWYLVAPKSFGRHFAECVAAYEDALRSLAGSKDKEVRGE